MNYTIIQSLVRPLPVLYLSEKQYTRIMAPVLNVRLTASGVCQNTPKDVVHDSKEEHGLDIPDL